MRKLFEVIHEDDDLLVVNKPAGLVCHPTKSDETSSLIGRLRLYADGRFPVHLVNRLDRETSGLILAAKNPATAGLLGKLLQKNAIRKEYLAIVHGHVTAPTATICAPLGRDCSSPVAIKDCVKEDGFQAETRIAVLLRFDVADQPYTLLRVLPQSGRKHQIRIHLQHAGHPIVGDKLYGPDETIYLAFVTGQLSEAHRQQLVLPYQALHASKLTFAWRDQEHSFQAAPEPWFQGFCPQAVGPELREFGFQASKGKPVNKFLFTPEAKNARKTTPDGKNCHWKNHLTGIAGSVIV